MYKYTLPHPILIDLGYNLLNKDRGFKLRVEACEYVKKNRSEGAQAANDDRQGYGILAEVVIRAELGLPSISKEPHPVAYDLKSKKGVKIDVKCRGGEMNFEEGYLGDDGFLREAKHNLFARQLFDEKLNSDVFLLTHLKRPSGSNGLPGKLRERSWKLFICGWISKKRILNEAVFIPPGSITEQGKRWFPYQYQNIEIYNKCINGLSKLDDILELEPKDVKKDENQPLNLHMTAVDAFRIVADLVGRGILKNETLSFIKKKFKLNDKVKPILHPNQYFHLMNWLELEGQVSTRDIKNLQKIITVVRFEGL